MLTFEIPEPPDACSRCGRPLCGRQGSPYWPWDVPVLTAGGRWWCTACDNREAVGEPGTGYKIPVASADALARYDREQPPATGPGSSRRALVGEIRDDVRALHDRDRFAAVREVLGDIHPDDFTDVPDADVVRIRRELRALLAATD